MSNKPKNYDSPFHDEYDKLELDEYDEVGVSQTSQLSDFTYQNGVMFPVPGILNSPTDMLVASDISLLDSLNDDIVNNSLTD